MPGRTTRGYFAMFTLEATGRAKALLFAVDQGPVFQPAGIYADGKTACSKSSSFPLSTPAKPPAFLFLSQFQRESDRFRLKLRKDNRESLMAPHSHFPREFFVFLKNRILSLATAGTVADIILTFRNLSFCCFMIYGSFPGVTRLKLLEAIT